MEAVKSFCQGVKDLKASNAWIAPQFIHLSYLIEKLPNLKWGGQDASDQESGAFTGDTSALSLKDIGAHFVILGHSERRSIHREKDELVNAKVKTALKAKLVPILCVGETLEERKMGHTNEVVLTQLTTGLRNIELTNAEELIIAYEPVWAIGTGVTATSHEAEEVHAQIRAELLKLYPKLGAKISILYGGSVKPSNFKELLSMPNVNGGLVGGASLDATDYLKLVEIANS